MAQGSMDAAPSQHGMESSGELFMSVSDWDRASDAIKHVPRLMLIRCGQLPCRFFSTWSRTSAQRRNQQLQTMLKAVAWSGAGNAGCGSLPSDLDMLHRRRCLRYPPISVRSRSADGPSRCTIRLSAVAVFQAVAKVAIQSRMVVAARTCIELVCARKGTASTPSMPGYPPRCIVEIAAQRHTAPDATGHLVSMSITHQRVRQSIEVRANPEMRN